MSRWTMTYGATANDISDDSNSSVTDNNYNDGNGATDDDVDDDCDSATDDDIRRDGRWCDG